MLASAIPASGQTAGGSDDTDDRVTGQRYVRHDGGTDQAIRHCTNRATSRAPDNDLADADAGVFGPDTCANSGGLDQNIYGNSVSLP